MATTLDIITDSLRELAVVDPIDPVPAEMAAFGLTKLNRLLDRWNASRQAVYADVTTLYTLTALLNPHTIGPSGTFTVTQRPVEIDHLALVQSGVYTTITRRDQPWWREIGTPAMTSAIPSDWTYEAAWPNGQIKLWPIPTTAHQVAVTSRVLLTALALATTFTLPPAYQDAVTLTLAESLASALGATVTQELKDQAREARAAAFSNNHRTPRLITADAGMPGGRGGSFDMQTGTIR